MPAPLPEALSQTARLNFAGRAIEIPVQWGDMGPLYPQAFSPAERAAQANPPDSLFHEPTLNRYHTTAARSIGQAMERFIKGVCTAIAGAVDKWMRTASVVSVCINGPVGTLLPGGVIGPPLKPLILAAAPCSTELETEYANAIAEAISSGWSQWHMKLSGLLSYPSFAAAPMPAAPPTPNVPASLILFASSGEHALSPAELKSAMAAGLTDEGQHAAALFDAIAQAFYSHFQTFKQSTQITRVMGTGPVSAAPGGPVSGGMVIPAPGNFV